VRVGRCTIRSEPAGLVPGPWLGDCCRALSSGGGLPYLPGSVAPPVRSLAQPGVSLQAVLSGAYEVPEGRPRADASALPVVTTAPPGPAPDEFASVAFKAPRWVSSCGSPGSFC